ncbi:MAG: DUF2155 domain-containing protein, partial [Pseudomonadota bacterium]
MQRGAQLLAALALAGAAGWAGAQSLDDQILDDSGELPLTLETEAPAAPAATPEWRGRVETSPLPRIRVIRPAGSEKTETSELPTTDSAATAVNQVTDDQDGAAQNAADVDTGPSGDAAGDLQATDNGTGATGSDEGSLPVIRRGGEDGRTTETFRTVRADEATGDAGDASDRGARFLRAPERQSIFDPDAPSPVAPIRSPKTTLQEAGRLRQLDKMTGTTITFDMAVGETRKVERLQIRMDACRAPSDNDTHGTIAFLKVWDTKRPDEDA